MNRQKDLQYQKHLMFLSKNVLGFPSPVLYIDEVYIQGEGFRKNPKPYYKRCYRARRSSYHKKLANRKIRRYNKNISNGNTYKKIYDFWWQMY